LKLIPLRQTIPWMWRTYLRSISIFYLKLIPLRQSEPESFDIERTENFNLLFEAYSFATGNSLNVHSGHYDNFNLLFEAYSFATESVLNVVLKRISISIFYLKLIPLRPDTRDIVSGKHQISIFYLKLIPLRRNLTWQT